MAEDGDMLKQTKIYPLPNVDQLANVKDKGKPCERCAENNATINSLNNYIKKLEKEINDLGGNLNLDHPLNKTGSGPP